MPPSRRPDSRLQAAPSAAGLAGGSMELDDQRAGILDSLEEFEGRILEFDSLVRRDESHRALVHILFRLAHNLKGAFSMAGLEASVGLLHACETCLDSLRSVDARPSESLGDLLVSTVDALRGGLVAGGGPGAGREGELARELEREAAELRSSKSPKRGIDFALDEEELRRLEAGLAAGASLYMVEKLVGAGMDEKSVLGLPILETIAESGSVIATRLRRQESSPRAEGVLVVLFSTALGLDELKFLIFDTLLPIAWDGPRAPPKAPGGKGKAPEADSPLSSSLPRILIVDDEALSLVLLQKALVDFGRIDAAPGGREALDRFAAALDGAPYSVVFLDINMEDMNGMEVLREMRRLERAKGIAEGRGASIVMSSAIRDFSTISASFRDQAELYLIKPVDSAKIREAMIKLGKKPIGR